MMYPLTSGSIYRVSIGLSDGVIIAQTTNRPTELLYSKAGWCYDVLLCLFLVPFNIGATALDTLSDLSTNPLLSVVPLSDLIH